MKMHTPAIYRTLRRSGGVGLVTAIFLLVVLAGLAVAMVTISTSQQSASALDVQGARAYQAARAGIEWGLYQNLRTPGRRCDAAYSFALPADSSLNSFTVTVRCRLIAGPATPAAPDSLDRWVIEANACNQPGAAGCPNLSNSADYVQRRIEVQL
jgi:MSHA biogenesis protein MshP